MSFARSTFGAIYAEPVRNGLTRPTAVRGEGYRMVNMGEIFAYDRIGDQEMERVLLNDRELRVATLHENDLLFARSSLKPEGTGKCSIVGSVAEPTTFESHLIRVRLNATDADARFYFYFFQSYYGRASVLSLAKQVGAAGLPGSKLAGLEVPRPDRRTQTAVADVLETYDDLIDANSRRIALLERAAEELFHEWFVALRFPGREHSVITDGVPAGWERVSLGTLAQLNYGKGLRAQDRIEGRYAVYGSSGVVGTHEEPLVGGPGIVVGRKGNVGAVYWSPNGYWPIDTVYYVTSDQSTLWLYHALRLTHFVNTDVAVPGLNRDFAYSRVLLRPEPRIAREFNETAAPFHAQIANLRAMNARLRTARDLLLTPLIMGDVRALGREAA
jgi:type I restriction enzyme, S subunit